MKALLAALLVSLAAISGQGLAREPDRGERAFWPQYAQEQRGREMRREDRRQMRREDGERGQERRGEGRLSPEERQQLREDLRQHGRDIYPPRHGQGRRQRDR